MAQHALDGVRLEPNWTSLCGAISGLLHYLGRPLPQATVMGLTGHAFRLTLDRLCTTGSPYEFNWGEQLAMYQNLGLYFYRQEVGAEGDLEQGRAQAWRRICDGIDRGYPAIAFGFLDMLEYGLVAGYDDEGGLRRYYGHQVERPPAGAWFPAEEMPHPAHRRFSRLDVLTLLGRPEEWERERAERAAIRFAVDSAWVRDDFNAWSVSGLAAYEYWELNIGVLGEKNHAPDAHISHAYNLVLVQHARQDAADFLAALAEAREAQPGPLAAAARQYRRVADELRTASQLLPYPSGEGFSDPERRKQVAAQIHAAAEAERQGLAALEYALRKW